MKIPQPMHWKGKYLDGSPQAACYAAFLDMTPAKNAEQMRTALRDGVTPEQIVEMLTACVPGVVPPESVLTMLSSVRYMAELVKAQESN